MLGRLISLGIREGNRLTENHVLSDTLSKVNCHIWGISRRSSDTLITIQYPYLTSHISPRIGVIHFHNYHRLYQNAYLGPYTTIVLVGNQKVFIFLWSTRRLTFHSMLAIKTPSLPLFSLFWSIVKHGWGMIPSTMGKEGQRWSTWAGLQALG